LKGLEVVREHTDGLYLKPRDLWAVFYAFTARLSRTKAGGIRKARRGEKKEMRGERREGIRYLFSKKDA
jgi:hypothetical protein